jgi:DNA-binding YbaB/EbfC family protein
MESPMPDMLSLFRQAQLMKDKMSQFQKEMENEEFEGSAGGNAVNVIINGKHEIQSLTISPKLIAAGDQEQIENLVKAAINNAGREVNNKVKEEVNRMTGGLGIPGLL